MAHVVIRLLLRSAPGALAAALAVSPAAGATRPAFAPVSSPAPMPAATPVHGAASAPVTASAPVASSVSGTARQAPIQTRDDLGNSVTLQAPARRAITLSPHATELVYAAGAGAYLVGTVDGSNFPPAARAVRSIGDGVRPSIETIASLSPDLVVAWLPGAAQGIEPLLQRAGVAVFYSRPERLADLPGEVERLGKLFGTSAQASIAANSMRARLAALSSRYRHRAPIRVFIQISRTPLISLNRQSIVSDAVRVCGGVNVFANAFGVAPRISQEAALASRPQAILTGLRSAADIARETAAWRAQASDPAHPPVVLAFDPDILYRPGPRLVDLTSQLCEDLDRVRRRTP